MISRQLIKSSLVYTIAGSLPLAASLILLPFYISNLSKAQMGEFAVYQALTLIFQIICTLNLESSVLYFFFRFKKKEQLLRKYLSSVVISILILGICFTILFLVACLFLKDYPFKNLSLFPFIFMCWLTAFFNGFLKVINTLLINEQKPGLFFILNSSYFIITIVGTIVTFQFYPGSLIGPLWGRLAAAIFIFATTLFYIFRIYGVYFNNSVFKKAIAYSYPYVFNMILLWLMSYFDRFLLGDLISLEDLGVYDVILKCCILIEFVLNGLITAINPKIFSSWADKGLLQSNPETNKYFNVYTLISLLVIATSIIGLPIFIPLFIQDKSYHFALDFVPLICLSYCFKNLLHMYAAPFLVFGRNKSLPKIYIFSAVSQVLISYMLIKYWGLAGAVLALVINRQLIILFFGFECGKFFKFNFNKLKIWYLPTFYFLLVLIGEYFKAYFNFYILYFGEFFILCIMIYFVYKNEIPQYINFMKRMLKKA